MAEVQNTMKCIFERERCECEELTYGVVDHTCAYGYCIIYRCRWCGGVTEVFYRDCSYPNKRPKPSTKRWMREALNEHLHQIEGVEVVKDFEEVRVWKRKA